VTVGVLRQEIKFEFRTVIRRERKPEKHEIIDKNHIDLSPCNAAWMSPGETRLAAQQEHFNP
jgi:hypothetical protein